MTATLFGLSWCMDIVSICSVWHIVNLQRTTENRSGRPYTTNKSAYIIKLMLLPVEYSLCCHPIRIVF